MSAKMCAGPFGKPCGRESPDGDPLHPEQEVVVVETAFRPCRKEKEVDAHRRHAEQDYHAACAVDEVPLGFMGSDFVLFRLGTGEVIQGIESQRQEECAAADGVQVAEHGPLVEGVAVGVEWAEGYPQGGGNRSHPESGCILNRLPGNPWHFSANPCSIVNASCAYCVMSLTVVNYRSYKVFINMFVSWRFLADFRAFPPAVVHCTFAFGV